MMLVRSVIYPVSRKVSEPMLQCQRFHALIHELEVPLVTRHLDDRHQDLSALSVVHSCQSCPDLCMCFDSECWCCRQTPGDEVPDAQDPVGFTASRAQRWARDGLQAADTRPMAMAGFSVRHARCANYMHLSETSSKAAAAIGALDPTLFFRTLHRVCLLPSVACAWIDLQAQSLPGHQG